tara:strand:+ start:524 stop:817 length:294 start_codon:yes stop_codon:yes gene_type:complete
MPIYDHDAVLKAYPDAVTINNDTGVFKGDGTKIEVEQSKIDEARTTIDAEYAALEYSRNRAAEYPSIEDQLDTIYHNGVAGWKATIKAIKDKYPKPS